MHAALAKQGWVEGKNLLIDDQYSITSALAPAAAQELFDLHPDAFLTVGSANLLAAADLTKTIPIVSALAVPSTLDTLVANKARPEGKVTGFANLDDAVPGKCVDLLRDLSPGVTRAGYLLGPLPTSQPQIDYPAFSAAAAKAGIEPVPIPVPIFPWSDAVLSDIGAALADFAKKPNGGLVIDTGWVTANRPFLYAQVAKLHLPTVWGHIVFGWEGAMVSYATDNPAILAGAADYAGLIFNGAKVADLPVQSPEIYRLTVNLTTAKVQGFTIPPALLAGADDVIR